MKYFRLNKLVNNPNQALILIVLFGLILRLVFFSGMGISDSLAYSKAANDLNTGKGIDPDSTLTLSTRIGLTIMTALSYKLFGINDFSAIFFVLLTSVASIILIFYFGRLLFSDKVGLIAAILLSIFPLNVVYATRLVSDLPSAFFMSLGVYIFLYHEKNNIKNNLYYFLSGIFIGLAYLIRESALLIALFFVTYITWKKKIKFSYFFVPLGVLSILVLESIIFFHLTGDLFYRTSASQDYLADANEYHNYFGRLNFPTGLLHYPYIILTSPFLSLFYISIGIATVYLIYTKRKNLHEIYLWFFVLLLYLSFGSASFSGYIPFRAVDRYLSIITVPGLLLLAVFFSEKKKNLSKFVPVFLAVLLVSSITGIYFSKEDNIVKNLDELGVFLKENDKKIYIDSRSKSVLEYIFDYDSSMDISIYSKEELIKNDSYFVINKEMIRNLIEADKRAVFPVVVNNPPKEWILMKEIGSGNDKILVYHVPK